MVQAIAVARDYDCFYEALQIGEAGLIVSVLFEIKQKLNRLQQFFQSFYNLVFKFR